MSCWGGFFFSIWSITNILEKGRGFDLPKTGGPLHCWDRRPRTRGPPRHRRRAPGRRPRVAARRRWLARWKRGQANPPGHDEFECAAMRLPQGPNRRNHAVPGQKAQPEPAPILEAANRGGHPAKTLTGRFARPAFLAAFWHGLPYRLRPPPRNGGSLCSLPAAPKTDVGRG